MPYIKVITESTQINSTYLTLHIYFTYTSNFSHSLVEDHLTHIVLILLYKTLRLKLQQIFINVDLWLSSMLHYFDQKRCQFTLLMLNFVIVVWGSDFLLWTFTVIKQWSLLNELYVTFQDRMGCREGDAIVRSITDLRCPMFICVFVAWNV